jgi:hypothetical protein
MSPFIDVEVTLLTSKTACLNQSSAHLKRVGNILGQFLRAAAASTAQAA